MTESYIPRSEAELTDKVLLAMAAKGVNVTEAEIQDPNWVTDRMNRLPQFAEYSKEALRAAVVEAIRIRTERSLAN